MMKSKHACGRELFTFVMRKECGELVQNKLYAADSTSLRYKLAKWYPKCKIVSMTGVAL